MKSNLLMMLVIIVGSLLLIGADGNNDEKSSEDSSLELLKSGEGKGGQFTFLDFHSGMSGEEVFDALAFDKNEYAKRKKAGEVSDYDFEVKFGTTDELIEDLKRTFSPYRRGGDTSDGSEWNRLLYVYYDSFSEKDARAFIEVDKAHPLIPKDYEYSQKLYDNDMFHSMGWEIGSAS